MPRLIVNGVTHELVEQQVTIGRAPGNSIQIEDVSVSSHHAELRSAGKTYQLKDLGSTNGTRVNGTATEETTLRPGDRLRFGGIEARFESDVVMSATQPLPRAAKIEATPAETSARPTTFINASPFRARNQQRDRGRLLLFIGLAIALLVLLGGIVAVFTMHGPTK